MTANVTRMNTAARMAPLASEKASESGKSFFQKVVALFVSARNAKLNRKFDAYSFSQPHNQRTYLSMHKTWQ